MPRVLVRLWWSLLAYVTYTCIYIYGSIKSAPSTSLVVVIHIYIYMCIYLHVWWSLLAYVHICTHRYTQTLISRYLHVHTFVHARLPIFVYKYVRSHIYILDEYKHVYVYLYAKYTHMYVYMYLCACIHICMYTCVYVCIYTHNIQIYWHIFLNGRWV